MSLSDYIKENQHIYEMAMEIEQALPQVRKNIVVDFFEKISSSLQAELGTTWTVDLKIDDLSKRWKCPIEIYKKDWIKDDKNSLIFGFDFDSNDYCRFYFGISHLYVKGKKNDIANKFKSEIKLLNNYELKTEDLWLYFEYLPNIKDTDDLPKYIQFHENAEEVLVKKMMHLIKIFELDSKLMTKINDYLRK